MGQVELMPLWALLDSIPFWSGTCTVALCVVGLWSRWAKCIVDPEANVPARGLCRRSMAWLRRITVVGWISAVLMIGLTVASVLLAQHDNKRKARAAQTSLAVIQELQDQIAAYQSRNEGRLQKREEMIEAGQHVVEPIKAFVVQNRGRIVEVQGEILESDELAVPFLLQAKHALLDFEDRMRVLAASVESLDPFTGPLSRVQVTSRELRNAISAAIKAEQVDALMKYEVTKSRNTLEHIHQLLLDTEAEIERLANRAASSTSSGG